MRHFALIAVLTASGGGTIPATGGVNFQGYNVNPPNYA